MPIGYERPAIAPLYGNPAGDPEIAWVAPVVVAAVGGVVVAAAAVVVAAAVGATVVQVVNVWVN